MMAVGDPQQRQLHQQQAPLYVVACFRHHLTASSQQQLHLHLQVVLPPQRRSKKRFRRQVHRSMLVCFMMLLHRASLGLIKR